MMNLLSFFKTSKYERVSDEKVWFLNRARPVRFNKHGSPYVLVPLEDIWDETEEGIQHSAENPEVKHWMQQR